MSMHLVRLGPMKNYIGGYADHLPSHRGRHCMVLFASPSCTNMPIEKSVVGRSTAIINNNSSTERHDSRTMSWDGPCHSPRAHGWCHMEYITDTNHGPALLAWAARWVMSWSTTGLPMVEPMGWPMGCPNNIHI